MGKSDGFYATVIFVLWTMLYDRNADTQGKGEKMHGGVTYAVETSLTPWPTTFTRLSSWDGDETQGRAYVSSEWVYRTTEKGMAWAGADAKRHDNRRFTQSQAGCR